MSNNDKPKTEQRSVARQAVVERATAMLEKVRTLDRASTTPSYSLSAPLDVPPVAFNARVKAND